MHCMYICTCNIVTTFCHNFLFISIYLYVLVFLRAPIAYGRMFDSFCILWSETCEGKGACALYDTSGKLIPSFKIF